MEFVKPRVVELIGVRLSEFVVNKVLEGLKETRAVTVLDNLIVLEGLCSRVWVGVQLPALKYKSMSNS